MSESNAPRNTRRRSERAEQLYSARMLPDADDTPVYEAQSPEERAARRRQAYEQRLTEPARIEAAPSQTASRRSYDASQFLPNEATAPMQIVRQPKEDTMPEGPAAEPETPAAAPAQDRSALAANLSAYYRRAANVAAQEEEDPFASMNWSMDDLMDEPAPQEADPAATVNVYRVQEASWAQEERQTMLTGEDADGYQVKTEERRQPAKRRRKKRLVRRIAAGLGIAAVLVIGLLVYASLQESPQAKPVSGDAPVVTATPQPIKGYNAAPALTVSHRTNQAIEEISGPVEMATCAVTETNVLTRSLRVDGLYDYYLFAADGRLLAYFDKLPENGMHPMDGGGFYTAMEPWLVDEEGRALLPTLHLADGEAVTAQPMLNGWAQVFAPDGESNLVNREGQLISRLWFCRSFPMTGSQTVAYVDTGVEGSQSRYTLYVIDGEGEGSVVKWRDAADDRDVVACAAGMVYLQNGQVYRLADLLSDPAAQPLLTSPNVRLYTDCAAMVAQDAATGKYALYVNGQQHYGFEYDSILPVESDVRWQGDILPADSGQAMVLAITGADYPQPLSHYFVLSQNGAEEYVALSAVTNCPILLD